MTVTVVLSRFDTGPEAWGSGAAVVVLAAAYGAGARSLAQRGRRWAPARTASFLAGSLVVFVALGTGLAVYDDVDASVHVVQHVLLMMVAPGLLVAGRPLQLLVQAGPRWVQSRVVRLARGRVLALATGPLAFVLYFGSMGGYFLSPLYGLSLRNDAVHAASHAVFLLVGLGFWTGLTGEGSRRRPFATRIAVVVAGMPIEALLGFAVMLWPRPLAPGVGPAQTRAAGQILLMASMAASGATLALLALGWAAADERAGARVERRTAGPDGVGRGAPVRAAAAPQGTGVS